MKKENKEFDYDVLVSLYHDLLKENLELRDILQSLKAENLELQEKLNENEKCKK